MKIKLHRILSAVLVMLLFTTNLMANNIQVSNISLTGENTTDNYVMVQFNLTWENSWRYSGGPANWDAAWVIVKYRITSANGGDDLWKHATLNSTGHSGGSGTGTTITPAPDGTGAFIYRSADGTGAFSITGAQLRWNYGANSVTDAATVDVRVFAIEMVYVPQGAFTVGSGGTESGSFTNGPWTSGATIALSISSENVLTIANSAGNLWGISSSGDNTIGGAGTLPAAFPKGYAAFYCMKYEISQQQYVDFLNTLTSTQAANRYSSSSSGYRYGISVSGGVYGTANPYVACNYLSWMDGAAYADWSGLRPMTELEFEKACRGPVAPVANEYAWGTTSATAATGISNPGATNETASNSGANAAFVNSGTGGPLRAGVFATGSSTRIQSGASYWGIMELSGNLWERTVTVGNTDGRNYTGVHGNGVLSANGHATETAWPGLNSVEVTGATGSGFRGSDWDNNATIMRVSDRSYAAATVTGRPYDYGFRGVRSVP